MWIKIYYFRVNCDTKSITLGINAIFILHGNYYYVIVLGEANEYIEQTF